MERHSYSNSTIFTFRFIPRCVVALVLGLLSTVAFSLDNHFYLNFGFGGVIPIRNSNFTGNSDTILYAPTSAGAGYFNMPNVNWQNYYRNGYETNLAVGYQTSSHFRVEGEFLYQNYNRETKGNYDWQEVSPVGGDLFASSLGNSIQHASSTVNLYSFFANAYYDFTTNSKFTPFIGAGVGVAIFSTTRTHVQGNLSMNDTTSAITTVVPVIANSPYFSTNAFAWQVKAGLAYQVSQAAALVATYRLYGTNSFKMSDSNISANTGSSNAGVFNLPGQNVNGFLNNIIELSVRYTFL